MPKKPFRSVFGLIVFPDFANVMAGEAPPPRVNHSEIDFERLRTALLALFPYGPCQRLRVPNDTIDQVTLDVRRGLVELPQFAEAAGLGSLECEDFGHLLIEEAGRQAGDVVDVRKAWSGHHALSDRDFAPPPTILPMLVETADFEDAMCWLSSARTGIGLLSVLEHVARDTPDGEVDQMGRLPAAAHTELQQIFGCPFEQQAVLMQLAVSRLPDYLH